MRFEIKKSYFLGFSWVLGAMLLCFAPQASSDVLTPENVFPAGTFSLGPVDGRLPKGWLLWDNCQSKVGLINDKGRRYLILTIDNAAANVGIFKELRLQPDWKYLVVRTSMAAKKLQVGKIDWQNARLDLQFENTQRQRVGGYPDSPILRDNTDWTSFEKHLKVPEGAVYLRLEPSMLNTTGTIGVGDIGVFVSDTPPVENNLDNKALPGVDFTPPALGANGLNAGGEAFPQGAFDTAPVVDGLPAGWLLWDNSRNKVKLVDDNGERWLRLSNGAGAGFVGVFSMIKLKPEWKQVSLSTRVKAKGLRPTEAALQPARIDYAFEDANHQTAGAEPPPLRLTADTDWVPVKVNLPIPPGAAYLKFELALFSGGEMGVDAITVTGSEQVIPAPPDTGVFSPGAFGSAPLNGKLPDGWQVAAENAAKIALADEAGKHCLTITNDNPAQAVSAAAQLKLDPKWQKLTITTHMAAQNLKPGKEDWHNARLPLRFVNDKGEKVGDLPIPLALTRDSAWRTMTMQVAIPPGATYLKLQAGLFFATGTMKLDDLIIKAE